MSPSIEYNGVEIMGRRLDFTKAFRNEQARYGLSVKDEAEWMENDVAARWLQRRSHCASQLIDHHHASSQRRGSNDKVRTKITCSDFQAVRELIATAGIAGQWTERKNHCQFYAASGAVLSYWKSTGTITFQGPKLAAAELRAIFLQTMSRQDNVRAA
jgi:hypothetical protein